LTGSEAAAAGLPRLVFLGDELCEASHNSSDVKSSVM
jgi:hypothetical protein